MHYQKAILVQRDEDNLAELPAKAVGKTQPRRELACGGNYPAYS
jgi:hypothetical protein